MWFCATAFLGAVVLRSGDTSDRWWAGMLKFVATYLVVYAFMYLAVMVI